MAAEVVVAADAGPGAGLGHIARCSALAVALGTRRVACRCIAVGADEPPPSAVHWECVPSGSAIGARDPALLLIDSYELDPDTIRDRLGARRLAVMHDMGRLPASADLTVTSVPDIAWTRDRVVGGPRMTCLGPMFWGLPEPSPVDDHVGSVLVTTGGGDPGSHAAALASAIRTALPGVEVTLVRGPHASFPEPDGIRVLDRPASLLGPLSGADLVVTAAGGTLREALAVGKPTLALVTAENQRGGAKLLADRGATELFAPEALESISQAVIDLAADRELRQRRVRRGRELIDGHGALRVGFLLWRLLDEEVSPRAQRGPSSHRRRT